jgi:L-fucose isomerase
MNKRIAQSKTVLNLPKIGIRPVIDGRRQGVRESVEEKTMQMAQAAKELIQKNLRYASNGEPFDVIIAESTIGGVQEAVACQKKFEREGVFITLTVTPIWCYGLEVLDQDPRTIKAVWGFNGTERPGAVFLAAAMSAYAQIGMPAFSIYGHDVQDADDNTISADVSEKLLLFAKAAVAAASMRGSSYLQIGSMCMGIAGSFVDPHFLQEYLGMRIESVDEVEILRRMEQGIYDINEFKRAKKWVSENCKEGFDKNDPSIRYSREQKDKQWEFSIKTTMIIRDLLHGNEKLAELGFVEESCGHNSIVGGFQGQRQWTDYLPNADFSESLLNSQIDWNGIRPSIPFATENDALNGLTMLFEHLLTDRPSVFADVRTYWSPDAVKRVTGKELTGFAKNGVIHLLNSGAAALEGAGTVKDDSGNPIVKPWYDMNELEGEVVLRGTEWCPANVQYFRGGGFSSHYVNGSAGSMPITMARLNLIRGLGPTLQIAEGYTCTLDPEVHKILEDRTDPTWPTTWFAPILTGTDVFKDVYSVMANWGANHSAFCYGHVGAEIITLASMLRIPVTMHNVASERIFRPHAWSGIGTKDSESVDRTACKLYGPLYGGPNI